MPGQAKRKKSVRLKLNTIRREFEGKNVLLVDDSIVRGTTATEIVQMARAAGANKVYFSSAAPPIRYPNIYGIDLPSQSELIAYQRNEQEIATKIGCEWVVYQTQNDLEESVRKAALPNNNNNSNASSPAAPLFQQGFDCSTFDGIYVTGQHISMGDAYFSRLHSLRNDQVMSSTKNRGNTTGSGGVVVGVSPTTLASANMAASATLSLVVVGVPEADMTSASSSSSDNDEKKSSY